MITVTLPLRTVSEANAHEHWRARQKRAKGQRGVTAMALRVRVHGRYGDPMCPVLEWEEGPLVVTLTRIAPRVLDSDNAVGALKHVRDGVADALGVKDNDPRVTWSYAQERGKVREHGVRIEIGARE